MSRNSSVQVLNLKFQAGNVGELDPNITLPQIQPTRELKTWWTCAAEEEMSPPLPLCSPPPHPESTRS